MGVSSSSPVSTCLIPPLGDRRTLQQSLALLHTAIASGQNRSLMKLLDLLSEKEDVWPDSVVVGPPGAGPLLEYRGETFFGTTIRYWQSPLGVAVRFRQWGAFEAMLDAGIPADVPQRMLVQAGGGGRQATRDFSSALDLFLWALAKPSYLPAHISETEVLSLLRAILKAGCQPQPGAVHLHRLVTALVQEATASAFGLETATALERTALPVMVELTKAGFIPGSEEAAPLAALYHLGLVFMADPRRFAPSQLLAARRLLTLLINWVYAGCNQELLPAPALRHSGRKFWYYYTRLHERPVVSAGDLDRVSDCHRKFQQVLNDSPGRLTLLARNAVRGQLVFGTQKRRTSFRRALDSLRLPGLIRDRVTYLDESALRPELTQLLGAPPRHPGSLRKDARPLSCSLLPVHQ